MTVLSVLKSFSDVAKMVVLGLSSRRVDGPDSDPATFQVRPSVESDPLAWRCCSLSICNWTVDVPFRDQRFLRSDQRFLRGVSA